MPIPSANWGNQTVVTVLTDRFNKDYLPEPANGEVAVPLRWFDGGDIATVIIKPEIKKNPLIEMDSYKPPELNVRDFLPGVIRK